MTITLLKRVPRIANEQRLYDSAPRWIQRILVNIEALRRDWFRRHDNYDEELTKYDPNWYKRNLAEQEAFQIDRLNEILEQAVRSVHLYRSTFRKNRIRRIDELQEFPLLDKKILRDSPLSLVATGIDTKALWPRRTSGSTGSPLTFYLDRSTVRSHQANIDALLAAHDCRYGKRRARFSGAYVVPYARSKPPFWIYIDYYRQLQCSAYHLGPQFYEHYLTVLHKTEIEYGTGYPTSWHLLANHLEQNGASPPPLKALITDSEGVTIDQQSTIEKAFCCPVYQTYGLGEVGQVAFQCSKRRYHILTRACIVEIIDEDGRVVPSGEIGEIVVTSLASTTIPFIRYRTGDLGRMATDRCTCGWNSPALMEIEGRIDDQILTPDGRWVGRLSHVTKPGIGILESQIVQRTDDRIVIRVVPDSRFEPASMDSVMAACRRYVGPSFELSWELVDRLPRTRSGKSRHVVREFE